MALGDVIARLSVHLGLETAAFERGTKRTEQRMSGFQKNMSRASAAVKTAFVGMLGVFTVDQFLSVTKAGLEYASSLGEVASQLGVTTKALQEYRYAASQAGIEQGEMDQALAQLTRRLGDASQGSKSIQAAFDRLGVSVRDANGHVIDAGDAIPLIAEGLQKIESPAERAAILVDLFGKAGQKLAPLLEGGAKGVNSLRDAAHKLGIVLSDEDIQNADETADKLSALKQVMEAKIAGFAARNAKEIADLADQLFRLATAALKAAEAWGKWASRSEATPGGAAARDENARIRRENRGVGEGIRGTTEGRGVWLPGSAGDARVNGQWTRGFRQGLPKGGRGGGGGSNAIDGSFLSGMSQGQNATKIAEAGLLRLAQAANDVRPPVAVVDKLFENMADYSAPKLVGHVKQLKPEIESIRNAAQGILDRLFPEEAAARENAEEIATLDAALKNAQISADDHAKAIVALRREYIGFSVEVANAAEVLSQNFGPSIEEISDQISDRLPDALAALENKSNVTTVRVADSFGDMAQDIAGSLSNLANSIKSGGFLDVLSSVISLGVQLGKAGAFGSKFASQLNSVPAYASGTRFHPGGMALVGERGPELVNLPRGASVKPNSELGGLGGIATIVPSRYFDVVVDGRIVRAGPAIADAGARSGVSQIRRGGQRRVA